MSTVTYLILALALWHAHGLDAAIGQNTAAQEQMAGHPCSADEYRQFDFWLGAWLVRDSTGTEVGTSRISLQADGCALLEQWTGKRGVTGTSLNYYDAGDGAWHQQWIGGDGLVLHLIGGLSGEEMTLTGKRATSPGAVTDRITWKSLPDGMVQQHWQVSSDGVGNWTRIFLGFYERQ